MKLYGRKLFGPDLFLAAVSETLMLCLVDLWTKKRFEEITGKEVPTTLNILTKRTGLKSPI